MGYRQIGSSWNSKMRADIDLMFTELYKEYTGAGLDATEAKEKSLQAVADALIAKEDAATAKEMVQQIIDGEVDTGALVLEIERKLNELESQYAPDLNGLKTEVGDARGNEATLGDNLNSIKTDLAQSGNNLKGAWSVWEEFERRGVNVDWYGAKGDGVTDDTQAFINANVMFKVLVLSKGKTYRLQNFAPQKGTIIIADGAVVSRFDTSFYGTTGSSASLIVSNDDISVFGGTWTELGNKDTWSGSILIENGSLRIDNAIIENSWGGVFGHNIQNDGKMASYVSITNCEIRYCSHNTYLSDIENLLFSNNRSHHSSRDGLRTHRNVKNIVVTDNHIYENGNGSIDQSQDAIDLFVAGYKCIIKNNFLYNNDYKGIDIKRSPDGDGEIVVDEEFIIEGNYIFGNKFSGIEITSNSTLGYIKNISIINNRIYENQSYGIRSNYGDIIQYSHNQIYDNAREGMRIENCINGGIVSDNIVYNNCKNLLTSTGIYILPTALNVDLFHNRLFSDNSSQTIGISYDSNGICLNNNVIGHTHKFNSGGIQNNKGERHSFVIKSDGTNSPIAIPRSSLLTSIILSFEYNDTFNITITKRNVANGSYSAEIYDSTITVTNAFTKLALDLSNLNLTTRRIPEDQIILVSISDTNESRVSNVYVGFEILS